LKCAADLSQYKYTGDAADVAICIRIDNAVLYGCDEDLMYLGHSNSKHEAVHAGTFY